VVKTRQELTSQQEFDRRQQSLPDTHLIGRISVVYWVVISIRSTIPRTHFLALLGRRMARHAQRLQFAIPEHFDNTTVGLNVVGHSRRYGRPASQTTATQRFGNDLRQPLCPPLAAFVEVMMSAHRAAPPGRPGRMAGAGFTWAMSKYWIRRSANS